MKNKIIQSLVDWLEGYEEPEESSPRRVPQVNIYLMGELVESLERP